MSEAVIQVENLTKKFGDFYAVKDIDFEVDRVAPNLDIALFEEIEQADLDEFIEIRQFVHGEDAAMHAGDESEVQGFLGGHARPPRELGRVDLTDDISELCAGRQSLRVTLLARPPRDGDLVLGSGRDTFPAGLGDRVIWILMNRTSRNVEVWQILIEESNQRAHEATLGLPLFAKKEHVVFGDEAVVDLRDDRVVKPDNPGKQFVTCAQGGDEVVTQFVLDRLGLPSTCAEFFERRWSASCVHSAAILR